MHLNHVSPQIQTRAPLRRRCSTTSCSGGLHHLHHYGGGGACIIWVEEDLRSITPKRFAFHCRLAAAQGLDEAQHNVGVMCENGFGVDRDAAEALRWQQLAAAQAHCNTPQHRSLSLYATCFNVAVCHDEDG